MSFRTAFRGLVYIGRANVALMTVQEHDPLDGSTIDKSWEGVTRMVLTLLEFDSQTKSAGDVVAVADTDEDAALIDYGTDGQLTFKLGDLVGVDDELVPAGVYAARLTAYEGAEDTEIFHEKSHDVTFQFVVTSN